MNLDEIKCKIIKCLKKLYKEDAFLFSGNNGKGLCERCIVFRFGLYLQEEFADYIVDCDFNSSVVNGQPRSEKPILNSDGQTQTNRFVDIIIHQRTSSGIGDDFICFEIKKWNNRRKAEAEKDRNNLNVLTNKYGYEYGFHLLLGKTLETTKWTIFHRRPNHELQTLVLSHCEQREENNGQNKI